MQGHACTDEGSIAACSCCEYAGKQAEGREWPGAATTSLTLPENQKRTKQRCLESYGRAWKSTLKGSRQTPSEVLHRCHCPFVCVAVECVYRGIYVSLCNCLGLKSIFSAGCVWP